MVRSMSASSLSDTNANVGSLRLAEVVSAHSAALDMTDGQPVGHSVRCAWIGMHLGMKIGLGTDNFHDLFYTLFLKDLGCSSNAARICQLYATNDHDFKRNSKLMDNSLGQVLHFVATNTAVKSGLAKKLKTILHIAMTSSNITRELIETRCERGAEIAWTMRFSDTVARGILDLDEHWDGGGNPLGRREHDISIMARIALLAQVVDVFHLTGGREAALQEVQKRAGSWFDPGLAVAFSDIARDPHFWTALEGQDTEIRVFALEPEANQASLDDDLLDDIADGFAQVVDAKSPFTSGHSKCVGLYTDMIATELGLTGQRKRWLVRGALLHDIGKLGISNEIIDKPSKLDEDEWSVMRSHPVLGEKILSKIEAFSRIAAIAKKAQSARSCDFGQLEERCGNMACGIDLRSARS
jgi:putative nucleotidyltransferase with HDIG domain